MAGSGHAHHYGYEQDIGVEVSVHGARDGWWAHVHADGRYSCMS